MAGVRAPVRRLRRAAAHRPGSAAATAAAASGSTNDRPRSAPRPGTGCPTPTGSAADLATVGLFTDAGPTPGSDGGARRDLPGRPTGTGRLRPGQAVRGVPPTAVELIEALRTASAIPRPVDRACSAASTVLSDHLAAYPEDWRAAAAGGAGRLLLSPQRMRTVLFESVGHRPRRAAVHRDGRARARLSPAARRSPAAASVPVAAADHRRARPGAGRRTVACRPPRCPPSARRCPTWPTPPCRPACRWPLPNCPANAAPARLAVVAMGKCGAKELNYLSDVDVIFAADHPRPTGARASPMRRPKPGPGRGIRTTTRMLATATPLATGLMRICGAAAWEVDAALRPGGQGRRPRPDPVELRQLLQAVGPHVGVPGVAQGPARGRATRSSGSRFLDITAPGVWSAAGRESFVDDVQAMRRRVEEQHPGAATGPRAQARRRWPAGRRVRRAAAATRARSHRPGPAACRAR